MFSLQSLHARHWIDSLEHDADFNFFNHFNLLVQPFPSPVFLCIGTPLLAADSLGPMVGSSLKRKGIPNVYGTLESPVHAENIELYRQLIEHEYIHHPIIAIDAALGSKAQTGYITLRRGPLKPGQAIGKSIRPIGHFEITGIFQNLYAGHAESLALFMSNIISSGICRSLTTKHVHPMP